MIAEIDANDPRWVRGRDAGGYGLDAHWSDDFHHAVHVALTGERTGYYADFDEPGAVAKVLGERYVNDGRYSRHRRRSHGRPARDVPADRFVVCLQNHDQVGNRARGERLASLVPPGALRLAAALLLLSPYVPLLFMGEEHGEANPFLYFVSHGDPALVEAVREGRRREFAVVRLERGGPRSPGRRHVRVLPPRLGTGGERSGRRAPGPLPGLDPAPPGRAGCSGQAPRR